MKVTKPRIAIAALALIVMWVFARECYINLRLSWIHAKLDSIEIGMTEEAVVRIMGGPGHVEAVEKNSSENEVAPISIWQIKHSYMLIWYRTLFGIEQKTFFTVDIFFDRESRKVVDIKSVLWNL
jgi:hypothetical protein